MPYKSKKQQRDYQRKHYESNKPAYLARSKVGKIKARKKIRGEISRYLDNHPCVDCGEDDPIVLEFDHQSDKVFNIGDAASLCVSIEKLMLEISKCDVRCANCHRRKTYMEIKDRLSSK